MSWVAAGIAVAGAVAGGIQANKAKKDAEGQAGAAAKASAKNKLPAFTPPPMPGYQSFNFEGTQKDAINADRMAYARSDRDFATRHGDIKEAEGISEKSVLADQKGDSELMPAIQAELVRAGIGNSLAAFGDTGANLTPGGAGEASVARNLGLGIMGFQDRNRQNRERSLSIAEDIFPRREFGMSGEDLALSALSDTVNRNAFNAGNYAAEVGAYGKNYEIDAANQNAQIAGNNDLAAAKAQAAAERNKALTAAITSGVGAASNAYGKSTATVGSSGPTSPGATYQPASGTYRPNSARYAGSNAWVPVGKYAG